MKDEDKIILIDKLLNGDINAVQMEQILIETKNTDGKLDINEIIKKTNNYFDNLEMKTSEEGFFGNVWVRKQSYPHKGIAHEGHKHIHDHVSLITSGSVKVEVDGFEPKIFKAPTYVTIKADKEHKITALEDNTTAWCVFALRKSNGMLTDYYNGDNSPYGHKYLVESKEASNILEKQRKDVEKKLFGAASRFQ